MAVVLVGGWGLVGLRVAQMLLAAPELAGVPLVLCGRNPARAQAAVDAALGTTARDRVRLVRVDVASPAPLRTAGLADGDVAAVVAIVSEPAGHLVAEVLERGLRYIDICKGVSELDELRRRNPGQATLMLGASLFAGLGVLSAAAACRQLSAPVETIEIVLAADDNEASGPDSISALEDLGDTFKAVGGDGNTETVQGYSDPKWIALPGGERVKLYRINDLAADSLPRTLACRRCVLRVGSFNSTLNTVLWWAYRLRLFSILPTSVKQSLLTNTTVPTAPLKTVAIVTARVGAEVVTVTLTHAQGQLALTTTGLFLLVMRLLGRDGGAACPSGFVYPEASGVELSGLFERMRAHGIEVTVDEGAA